MIESIEIERFRCFKHSKFDGFKQVNLIGGENNSGKTSLLESLLLGISKEISYLNKFGTERFSIWSELIWDMPEEGIFKFDIGGIKNGKKARQTTSYSIKSSSMGVEGVVIVFPIPLVLNATNRIPPTDIAEKLDLATRDGNEKKWLEGLECIDSSIEQVRTFTIKSNHRVYVKKEGESKYHNLSHMGDAVNKILEIIASISQNKNGILLIDEIENGIHYSHHEAFWEMLFKLCKEFEVQVFATSHSLEMIKAFNKVALEKDFAESSQYLEMFRSARSGEIVANAMKHDTLAYSIANHLSFRGEEK